MSSEKDPGDSGRPFALWGSRFQGGLAPEADALNRSLPIDRRLWREEIDVASAWTEGLEALGVLRPDEAKTILDGLERVGEQLADGAAEYAPDEDIHTLVERLLTEEIGEAAGMLRTGRSRNDQAATATRLWVMRAVDVLTADIDTMLASLLSQSEANLDVLVPSYTHLRRAQPVRLAHFFLSHFWPLVRDRDRWDSVKKSAGTMPLGAGAVAGSGFPVDRTLLQDRLGFPRVTANSMDAVSDRDFVAEFAFAGALLGTHLSRLAEDLILFSTSEFGFVRFSDAYSTGSSLMPQKRNPDIAELARGQSARLLGDLAAAVALLKSLPTGYNKDLQEDKSILFHVYDTIHLLLPAFAGAVETLQVDEEAAATALDPSVLAVDLADALVRSGVTFRDAHAAVGELVRLAEEAKTSILDIDSDQASAIHPALPAALWTAGADRSHRAYHRSVESRSIAGGTARDAVVEQISQARSLIGD